MTSDDLQPCVGIQFFCLSLASPLVSCCTEATNESFVQTDKGGLAIRTVSAVHIPDASKGRLPKPAMTTENWQLFVPIHWKLPFSVVMAGFNRRPLLASGLVTAPLSVIRRSPALSIFKMVLTTCLSRMVSSMMWKRDECQSQSAGLLQVWQR